MIRMWNSILPVLLIAALAIASQQFVEDPPYPASQVHFCLTFALGLFSWFHINFSTLRYSYGSLACGAAYGFFTLASALFPDLWLRWPAETLLGMGLSQLFTVVFYKVICKSQRSRAIGILLISVLSVTPLAVTPYFATPEALRSAVAATGLLLVVTGGVFAFFNRQRTTLTGTFSWILLAILAIGLLFVVFTSANATLEARHQIEQYLLFALLVVAGVFVAELVQVEQQLRARPVKELEASFRDPLTNLANRRALEAYGPQLITQSHEAGRAVSVIVADIDHFKAVNDTHGHPAGDTVLRQTAAKLSAAVRKSDLVARYGGEEFVIVLPGSPLAPALRLAERMRVVLQQEAVVHDGVRINRTASFGVATAFPEEPASLSELIERADSNLYRAKHEGRNRVKSDALPTNDF